MPKATNPFIILDSTDSTNNYAMGLLRSGSAPSGLAVFAREQTAGKGRRGKVWKSNKNENIILSIVVNTRHLSVQNQFTISVVAALGAFDFFKKYSTDNSSIKWPNDLFWNDSKAGGILIENIVEGDLWQWSVIGIGINVNQMAFDINKNAVSLKLITNQDFDVISLARELHVDVMARYEQSKTERLVKMLREYNENLFRLNTKVKLRKGNIVFETLITGVSENGKLLTKDALDRSFGFDEVAWVL